MDGSALASALALAASLAPGISVSPPPPAAVPVAARAPAVSPRPISALPLTEVAAHQGVFLRRVISGMTVEFSVDFGTDAAPRVLIKESGRVQTFALPALEAGTVAHLSRGDVPLSLKKGTITAGPARVQLDDLLLTVYRAAASVSFPSVKYALLLAGKPEKPEAVVTLRRDGDGIFWVAYHPAAELREVDWLLAVDGTLFGAKLEGPLLTFWSEPLPTF